MATTSLDDLRVRVEKRNVLAIIGAGVSIGATKNSNPVASWTDLLNHGVEYCVGHGLVTDKGWTRMVLAQIKRKNDTESLLSAAEAVTRTLGGPQGGPYRKWLRESVGSLKVIDPSVIETLHALKILLTTTNYDGLIEEVTRLRPVTWKDRAAFEGVMRGDTQAVLHLHGYWEDPESVVLGARSYEDVLRDPHAQTMLRAFVATRTLLFVGFGAGLEDPNFGALINWMRTIFSGSEYAHYRLGKETEVKKWKKQNPEERLILPLSFGADHKDLGPFLQSLVPPSRSPPPPDPPPKLPPLPRCFGRDDKVKDLVQTLLQDAPTPTPILGPPGIGKTTITLAALHDPEVVKRYQERRYFVRCEVAKTRDDLVGAVARAMGVEPGPHLGDRVLGALASGNAVLVLDNTETPWEADRAATEDLLASLAAVQGLALVASVRGEEKPTGPLWRKAIRLSQIGLDDARRIFHAITDDQFPADPRLDLLLNAVDRVPLAIDLLAHVAEAEPNLSGLWRRWQTETTALLRRAEGGDRLSNLELSIEISRTGPRMTDEARRLLSLLGVLPDGIAHEDLNEVLPQAGDRAANVLRRVGLAFDLGDRLRVLAPIREYVARKHPPSPDDLARAVAHYGALAEKYGPLAGKEGGAKAVQRLATETANLEGMIRAGLKQEDPRPSIRAACALTDLIRFSGLGTPCVLEKARDVAQAKGIEVGQANCIKSLGNIAL